MRNKFLRSICAIMLSVAMLPGILLSSCSIDDIGSDTTPGNTSVADGQGKPDIIGVNGNGEQAGDKENSGKPATDTAGGYIKEDVFSPDEYSELMSAYLKSSAFAEDKRLYELGISEDDYIWTIVSLTGDNLLERYTTANSLKPFNDYAVSEGSLYKADMISSQEIAKREISKIDGGAEFSYSYTVVDNGFAAKVKYGSLSQIRKLAGVKSVRICEEYGAPDEANVTLYNSTSANGTSTYAEKENHYLSDTDEYMGEGMLIAVLDTALDMRHPAFKGHCIDTETAKADRNYVSRVLENTLAKAMTKAIGSTELSIDDVYINNKLIFQYDYGNRDRKVTPEIPSLLSHGTHTAGIVVGYDAPENEDKEADTEFDGKGYQSYYEEYGEFRGVAPQAQLAFMKIFYEDTINVQVYSRDADIAAAIEDCIVLGADVMNLSIGAPRGFSVDNSSENYIYRMCEYADIVGISVQASVGNNFTGAYGGENGDYPISSAPDYGSVNSPASFNTTLAVGSYGGTNVSQLYAVVNAGRPSEIKVMYTEKDAYTDTSSSLYGKHTVPYELEAGTYNWVVVDGNGTYPDFLASNVKGKIALVRLNDKVSKLDQMVGAMRCEAAALIYVDSGYYATRSLTTTVKDNVPFMGMSLIEAENMTANWTRLSGTITFSPDYLYYNLMSEFSSWGVTDTLNIAPDIVALGGNVYSGAPSLNSYPDYATYQRFPYNYTLMSGTSMAAPMMSGYVARLRQNLSAKYPELSSTELTRLINSLFMSTAEQLTDQNGNLYSPRLQGSGVVNYDVAKTAQSYITVTGQNKPKIEVGEDPSRTGIYILNFNLNNLSSSPKTFKISLAAMTDSLCGDGKTISLISHILENCRVKVTVGYGGSVSGDMVTVPANGTTSVAVELKLTAENKKYIDDNFKYGSYVEGYIWAKEEGGDSLAVPYLAFYGDWEESPMLDTTIFDDIDDAYLYATRLVGTYYYGRFTAFLGEYPYEVPDGYEPIHFDADRLSLGSQTGGYYGLTSIYLGLLRNADSLSFNLFNKATGESYINTTISQIGKAGYIESYGTMYPVIQGLNNSYGADLPNNTVFTLSIRATKDTMGTTANIKDSISFDISVDCEAPKLYNDSKGVYTKEDGSVWLSLNVFDNFNLSCVGIYAYAEDGSRDLVDAPFPIDISTWKSGQKNTLEYDITKYLDKFETNRIGIILEDAAMNASSHTLVTNYKFVPEESEEPEKVVATSLECEESINIATNYSSDLGVKVQPYNAYYTISVDETANNTGLVEIDEARGLVVARKSGSVTVKIQSGDIVKTCIVNIYEIDGEWVYTVITSNGLAVSKYNDKATELRYALERDESVAYDKNGGVEYYRVVAYMGEGTHVVIPSEYNGRPVIDIGAYAFAYCYNMYSVTIPSSIRNLWYYSFVGCQRLTEIKFEGESQLLEIGTFAFESCSSLEEVHIPASVVNIGGNSFNDCYNIKKLTFGNNSRIWAIGSYAFAYSQIEELELPESIKEISNAFAGTKIKKFIMPESLDANHVNLSGCEELTEVRLSSVSTDSGIYANCTKLRNVTIPDGVKSISGNAFANCTMLTQIIIPDSVTSIGSSAFEGCTRLVSVRLGNGVTTLGRQAFAGDVALHTVYFNRDTVITKWENDVFTGCSGLEAFSVNPLNTAYMSDEGILYRKVAGNDDAWELFYVPEAKRVEILTIRPDVKSIASYTFIGHSELKGILIPEGGILESIGDYAFAACPSLAFVNLENATKLDSLGAYAFAACTSLTTVFLPDSLTTISQAAFLSCVYLEKCTFGSNLKSIGQRAFNQCIRFTGNTEDGLVLPATITNIGDFAFNLCNSIKKIDLSRCLGYTTIGSMAFINVAYAQEIILPETVERIETYAFAYCDRLEKINLEDTQVWLINNNAFYGDKALKSVTLPATVEDIRKESFGFTGLTSIELPANGALTVYGYAFVGCDNLTEIILPDNLKEIPAYAFAQTAIREIKIPNSVTRLKLSEYAFDLCNNLERFIVDEDNNFFGVTNEGILYVKAFYDSAYDVTVANTLFIVPINLQVKELDLTDVYTENENEKFNVLNAGLFFATKGIEKVYIPATITSISQQAFYYSSVKEIEFAENSYIDFTAYREIGIFAGCSMLEKVILPAHMTTVPALTFMGCSSLKEVVLPESVTRIAESAFAGCTSLEKINLENVQIIEESAFLNCTSLKEIYLGAGLYKLANTINALPFENCAGLESIIVDEDNKLFKSIDGVLFDKTGSILYLYPAAKAGTEYSVPEGVTKINELAFGYNKNLEKIILAESVSTIGTFAFYLTEKLDTYVFLSKAAPALESQFMSPTVGVVYTNFYNFSQLEFDYPIYCIYPKDGTGYDLWIYGIFFYKLTAMEDGENYTSPSQNEIPVVNGPQIEEIVIDIDNLLTMFREYIDAYEAKAPDSIKAELEKLYDRFDKEYEAYYDLMAESNFGNVLYNNYVTEADRIYAGYDTYYASAWTKIQDIIRKVEAFKSSGNYSESGVKALDDNAKLAKLYILEALSDLNLSLMNDYYEYYLTVINGIPTLSAQSEFDAYVASKAETLQSAYDAVDRSLYSEEVLEQIDIMFNTNNVLNATSIPEADKMANDFLYFIQHVYRDGEKQAFEDYCNEQLARLDAYKPEDYDYYSEINGANQWLVMDNYITMTVKPKLKALYLRRDVKQLIDDVIVLFDNQYTKIYNQKQEIIGQLDSLIDLYNMYFNLYDLQKKQLGVLVAEVKENINSAKTLDEITECFDEGFNTIWQFYEYNQKAYVEYRKALQAFETLSAEIKEEAMRELNALSYRVAGNAEQIAQLVAKYIGSDD